MLIILTALHIVETYVFNQKVKKMLLNSSKQKGMNFLVTHLWFVIFVQGIVCVIIMVIGLIAAAFGTYSSVLKIVQNLST